MVPDVDQAAMDWIVGELDVELKYSIWSLNLRNDKVFGQQSHSRLTWSCLTSLTSPVRVASRRPLRDRVRPTCRSTNFGTKEYAVRLRSVEDLTGPDLTCAQREEILTPHFLVL